MTAAPAWEPGRGHANDTDLVDLPPALALLPDEHVEFCRRLIRLSGLVPVFEAELARPVVRRPDGTTRRRAGRPSTGLSVEGMLVGLAALARANDALLMKDLADTLHRRFSPEMRASLGLTRKPVFVAPGGAKANRRDKRREEADRANAERQVERFLKRMLANIDPSPDPKDRIRTQAESLAARRPLTAQEQALRHARLDYVSNRLLEATWLMLPRGVRAAWHGSLGHDATFVRTWSEGRAKDNPEVASDPDAGWYGRRGDHRAPDDASPADTQTDGKRKWKFGYEIELAKIGPDTPVAQPAHPNLTIGFSVHKPGYDPAGACVRVLIEISRRHLLADPVTGVCLPDGTHPDPEPARHPTGWLGADRAYTYAAADTWALPVRALGYRPVMDYRDEDLGRQGSHAGMLLVEGNWYSPSIPTALVTATADRRARKITREVYKIRIKARDQYRIRMREYDLDPETGLRTGGCKMACPAAGTPGGKHRPTCRCPRKPASLVDLTLLDKRPLVKPRSLAREIPLICRQQTVDVPVDVLPKHQQELAFGSPEWAAVYHTLRNGIEGRNSDLKNTAKQSLEAAGRRRVRGIAAVTFLSGFMLAADNLRKIEAFYGRADWIGDGTMVVTQPKPAPVRRRRVLTDYLPVTPAAPGADSTAVASDSDAGAATEGVAGLADLALPTDTVARRALRARRAAAQRDRK